MRERRATIQVAFLTLHLSEDFLEYFNSNADGQDRSQDDAISERKSVSRNE